MTNELLHLDTERKKVSLPVRFDRLRNAFDPNYFTVNPKRAHEYLNLQNRDATNFFVDLQILIGLRDAMLYSERVLGGVSDRSMGDYQTMLFPDVYKAHQYLPEEGFSIERYLRAADSLDSQVPEFGGFQAVFKPGNVVLDIASGEAVTDMQFAQKFPRATLIGTDILYGDNRNVYPKKSGLQLTHADWKDLRPIPDNSVDAILSVQGLAMWGLPGSTVTVSDDDGFRVVHSLNRSQSQGRLSVWTSEMSFCASILAPMEHC